MLVLTRKINQSIMVGGDVEISILGVQGDKVRIGIVAPDSVGVYRKEVFLRIEAEGVSGDAAAGLAAASNGSAPELAESSNGSAPELSASDN